MPIVLPSVLSRGPVRIEPYYGFRAGRRLRLSARALRGSAPAFTGSGWPGAIKRMLGQFLSHEIAGIEAVLQRGAQSWHTHSDGEGFLHFDVEVDDQAMPGEPRWEPMRLRWKNRLGDQEIEAFAKAPGTAQDIAVISDIDDTIIETGITGGMGALLNAHRVLAQWPDQRRMVPGADTLFDALIGGASDEPAQKATRNAPPRAGQRALFYVSSSPWNLFAYLTTFQKLRRLPPGPTFLRDWGFDQATLGSASHGDHKTGWIAEILRSYPEKRFILVGDDTQGDLPAFTRIAAANTAQVAAIILRTTQQETPEHLAAHLRRLKSLGTPIWRGLNLGQATGFLSQHGLSLNSATQNACTKPVDAPASQL